MKITVGTFNLNNLFSRYNFKGEVEAIKDVDTGVDAEIEYIFTEDDVFRLRTFQGRLVNAKSIKDQAAIVKRILAMDVDVLAVQEVEDIDTLRQFNRLDLDGLYPYSVLVEGNDPRLIDLGLLSRFPIGGITSWQRAVHPDDPGNTVFGRDLLEVEIWDSKRQKRLFTLYNNHLKSHFVPFGEDQVEGAKRANQRRKRQAEVAAEIIEKRMRPNSRFIVLGDMNDPPDSPWLKPLTKSKGLKLVNALKNPVETRPPKQDNPMPPSTAWTHRFKESGQPAQYELYDQIWLSPALKDRQTGAFIDRRTKHGGDGSDHDPTWIELDI